MVKMKIGRMLTIGLIPAELEMLKQGHPLHCDMKDVGDKGHIILVVGDSNEKLKRMAEEAASAIEQNKKNRTVIQLPPGSKI
jgi:hypothetical protein